MGINEKHLQQYRALVDTLKEVEVKGATMPYTSLNGNMFSFLSPDGLLNLRLPEETREEIIRKYNTSHTIQHGAVLKEYVVIPAAVLGKTAEMKKLMKASYVYAQTLKPKPTKRKKG